MKLSLNELYILAALLKKPADGFSGMEIIDEVKDLTSGKVNMPEGGIYVHLQRLEKKGFLDTKWVEGSAVRGGRRKRCYMINALGKRALREASTIYAPVFAPVLERPMGMAV